MTTPKPESITPAAAKRARKNLLIAALAEYLVLDQTKQSIDLERGVPSAILWARIRNLTSVRGYATVANAIDALNSDLA